MISYFDYRPEYRRLRAEIDAAIARVLASGRLILGPEVEAFEREFAAYTGCGGAVGVNSGTDALSLALRALEVGPGDEVITVANAAAPPVAAIRAVGARPRLVDVDAETLVMDPALLERALGERTRCVLPVHLYGHPAPMEPILAFAERHGLHVVEDCAQAHGARYAGRHVGGFGAVGCFSFYPTKNLGALGDGGMCTTNRPELEQRMRMLRTYGYRGDRHAHLEGVNTRLDEIQAAVLRVKLRHLEEAIATRRSLAGRYAGALSAGPFRLPREREGCRHVYHVYATRAPDRERATAALDRAGIGWSIHYPVPVHRMEAYAALARDGAALPVTEEACRTVLSLPLYPGLPETAIERVAGALLAAA